MLDRCYLDKELHYNNSMPKTLTIRDLKAHITWWEKEGYSDEDTEVIMGKIGTSAMLDGEEVQKKVTDTDIQVKGSGCGPVAFTLVHH